jgi:hypothetical protein
MPNWVDRTTDDLMWIAVILVLYLLPAIVAVSRKHRQKIAILVLNVLLGWTFVGWVAALVWALVKPARQPVTQREYRRCPYCAEPILAVAVLCRYCDRLLPSGWGTARR